MSKKRLGAEFPFLAIVCVVAVVAIVVMLGIDTSHNDILGDVVNANTGFTCEDSDADLDPETKGVLVIMNLQQGKELWGNYFADTCLGPNNWRANSGPKLQQYSCNQGYIPDWTQLFGVVGTNEIECDCVNGVCQDDGPQQPSCSDADGDGYGVDCALGPDCNDNDASINPGATEICDLVDNNCNGQTDEGVTNACGTCGTVPTEVCTDGTDNDCDGSTDCSDSDCSNDPSCSIPEPSSDFMFGIEYGVNGMQDFFSGTHADTVKPTIETLEWNRIQPTEGGPYVWTYADKHVIDFQDAGFEDVHLLLSAESQWASIAPNEPPTSKNRNYNPKPEYVDDYIAFVKAVVERYDNDGIDDAPGLDHPVNMWAVEKEFTSYYPGDGPRYVELLEITTPAIKEANPNAKVMLAAFYFQTRFDGLSESEALLMQPNPRAPFKNYVDVEALLDAHQHYDYIDFHSLGHYSEIPAFMAWVNKELADRGVSKKTYIGDAFPNSILQAFGFAPSCNSGWLQAENMFPVTDATRCDSYHIIQGLRDKNHASHAEAKEWTERYAAIGTVQKFVVSAEHPDVIGINIGNFEDWPSLGLSMGTVTDYGMADRASEWVGDLVNNPRTATEERPAFYAVRMTVDNLNGFSTVEKLDTPNDVWAYKFRNNGKDVIVAWYDDWKHYGMDTIEPIAEVTIPWNGGAPTVTETPTHRSHGSKGPEVAYTQSGNEITFTLGMVPVFITE